MKTVLLVEDEEYAMQDLKEILNAIDPGLEIHTAKNASEAIAALSSNSYNAVFLDIELPGMSGIEMLKTLKPPLPPVVLVTAHAMHALDAFGLGVVECLLKPVDEDKLRAVYNQVVNAAMDDLSQSPSPTPTCELLGSEDHVLLHEGSAVYFVKVGSISRFQSSPNAVHVFFPHGSGTTQKTMDELEQRLDPKLFFRANTSEIININSVDHLKLNPNGHLIAHFLDGLEVAFDACRSRSFEQAHRL